MEAKKFSTHLLDIRDQHEQWRAWSMPLMDVWPGVEPSQGFAAESRAWCLDSGLVLAQLATPAARAVRSPELIRRLPVDHWVVSHVLQGTMKMETAGDIIDVRAGQSFVWSLGQTSCSERSQAERVDVFLSRDVFPDMAGALDAATGSVLQPPLARLLGEFLRTLLQRMSLVAVSDAFRLTRGVSSLVMACMEPSENRLRMAQLPIDIVRLQRVRQVVRAHLQSPLLGPDMLCRLVGMSRSNLYRLLEPQGGVTTYIQHHRLVEARRRLSASVNAQPVALIAHDLCFADLSTFSRAFRASFGVSPRELRENSAPPEATDPAGPPQSPCRFSDLLRPR